MAKYKFVAHQDGTARAQSDGKFPVKRGEIVKDREGNELESDDPFAFAPAGTLSRARIAVEAPAGYSFFDLSTAKFQKTTKRGAPIGDPVGKEAFFPEGEAEYGRFRVEPIVSAGRAKPAPAAQ